MIMDYLTEAQNDIEAYFETHHIPTYFYQCFFGELVKIWGSSMIAPNKDYLAESDDKYNIIASKWDDYSYKDQIDYHLTMQGGTGGWLLAFKEACFQCDLTDIYKYYNGLDWVRSDIFDGIIAKNMINILFDNKVDYDYYKFCFNKENKK